MFGDDILSVATNKYRLEMFLQVQAGLDVP